MSLAKCFGVAAVVLSVLALGAAAVPTARIVGTPGPDKLLGTALADTLIGRGGKDRLFGRHGNDRLIGGPGRDVLNGGPGRDRLEARDGYRDWVFCGGGRSDVAIIDAKDVLYTFQCEDVEGGQGGGGGGGVVTPPPPQPGTTRDNPIPIGTAATLSDGWRISVVAVTPDATQAVLAENQFNDPPVSGKQFFLVTVTATYTAAGSSSFDGFFRLRAVGPSAVSYATFTDSCGVIPNDISNAETFTGGTITGNVCWQVLTSDASGLVMYDDPGLAQNIYFALH
jgi:RTX calcium-binding nonapeptide repeat (4 copies)